MALDRQRILGELGSVMKQLQSADCGCLGKIFGNSQQAVPPMGNPLPTCGGCRRACCHGHGCYNAPLTSMPAQNMYSMPMEGTNPSQQPMPGNMSGFGPQIVNMMRGDQSKPQSMPRHDQAALPNSSSGLTGHMVIDAPQSPHGKIGLTPFIPPSSQGHFNPDYGSQVDVPGYTPNQFTGQMQNQFMPQPNSNTLGNVQNNNMTPWLQQNKIASHQISNTPEGHQMRTNVAPQQIPNATAVHHLQTTPPNQQSFVPSIPAAHQMPSNPSANPHGQHAQGIAMFNKMFPGVNQGGDLGFDPMAIAIQMNPNNHLQSAMSTMQKIMHDNRGTNKMFNPQAQQSGIGGNPNVTQNVSDPNNMIQQNRPASQGDINQLSNKQMPIDRNSVNHNQVQPMPQYPANTYSQTITNAAPTSLNQQDLQYGNNQQTGSQQQQHYQQMQQYGQQQIMDLNSGAPNLPVLSEEAGENNPTHPSHNQQVYRNEQAQEFIKEPIFPADTSRTMYTAQHQKNYGYNTLGQPVEMLPAKMYHHPEESLPQTLSPQPIPVKSRSNPLRAVNVKSTVSKTSLIDKKPTGSTPSRSQLQHIYNQYKGSQSYTQQNVRHPGGGTHSDGKLNVPQTNMAKNTPLPVERVGGDTVINNTPNNQFHPNKVDQVMGQIGDVPVPKSGGDSSAMKEAPMPVKKCRNGLQDMVFSSYPTSAAWTFHGCGRNEPGIAHNYRSRHY